MMSAPQPYPTVSNLTPAPDDAQIESKTPSICVDYLSHNWAQEDVWSSWKAMTKRKNEIANGVRLENASWRTWAKQRGNLKTISPETLNWLKDSDVTWLYGPLHEHADPVPPPKIASTADRLDLIEPSLKKSILKHRTISEMLTTPGRSTPPAIEALPPLNADGENGQEGPGRLFSVRSETNIPHSAARKGGLRNRAAGSPPLTSLELRSRPKPYEMASHSSSVDEKRHISFNQRVEQCISIDVVEDSDSDGDDDDDDDDDDDYDAEESSDEDEVLTMKSSPRMSPSLPMTSTSSLISSRGSSASGDHTTIAKLAPTLLKTSDTFPAPSPAVVDPTGFANHSVRSQPIGGYRSGTYYANAVPPAGGARWSVSDDYAGDFDYFSGPEVADEYDAPAGPRGAVHHSERDRDHIDAEPTSRSPEAALKSEWSQGSSDSSNTSIGGGESATSPPTVPGAAQPRSILKRRPSPDHQNEEGDVDILGVSQPGSGGSPPMIWRAAHGGSNAGGIPGGSFETNRTAAHVNGAATSTSPEAARSININSPPDSSSRGRPAQRLGSSASYERLQDATRGSRTRSVSGGASVSPSGSYEGSGSGTYAAAAHAGKYRAAPSAGSSLSLGQNLQSQLPSAHRDTSDEPSSSGSSLSESGMQRSAPAERERRDSFRDKGGRPSIETSGSGGRDSDEIEEVMEDDYPRSGGATGVKVKTPTTPTQGGPDRRTSAERRRDRARATASAADDPGLNIDTANVPSNDPHSSPAHQPGPTPLNTPVLALARPSGSRKAGAPQPTSPVLPRRTSATGAVVAPESNAPRVPLAEDYVDEDEGGIIGRAVEIVNTARDLIGALLGNADRGRAWREG